MVFQFKSRLKFIVPIGKGTCRIMTIDTGLSREEVVERVRYWFPTFAIHTRNYRQGRLRAYNNLPKYYLLTYEEVVFEEGKQKWKKIYTIRAYNNTAIEVSELKTGRVMRY